MAAPRHSFRESSLQKIAIRDLGLMIEGTRLEPILAKFEAELKAAGIVQLKPRFYLSTEWGVAFGTVAIAIPFYLAHPDLTEMHGEQIGHVEGFDERDILRYLRHEMGHVVSYAYRLYDDEHFVMLFGSISQPYVEEYRPVPFSARYVRHLPGWYAQKHPDEDWAETFAVWMTPGVDWKAEYAERPTALAKLRYCDEKMKDRLEHAPPVVSEEHDEDVKDLTVSLDQYYKDLASTRAELPHGLAGALRAIFEDLGQPEGSSPDTPRKPASALLRKIERDVTGNVYRWTGHFPERTRVLIRHLEDIADQLGQVYAVDREAEVSLAVTTLVTALAMNYVTRGSYLP